MTINSLYRGCRVARLFWASVLIFIASSATAGVNLSLKGSAISSNFGLQSQAKDSVSGSIDFDVGSHLRLGVTHRIENSNSQGYSLKDGSYYHTDTDVVTTANSLDLTVILFYGKLFLPYLKLGLIKKHYRYLISVDHQESEPEYIDSPALPNIGAGLGIQLSARFSLKLSYSISPGYIFEDPTNQETPTSKWDSVSSVGIGYKL